MPGTTGIEGSREDSCSSIPRPRSSCLTGEYSTEFAVEAIQKGGRRLFDQTGGRGEAPAEGGFTSFGIAQGSAFVWNWENELLDNSQFCSDGGDHRRGDAAKCSIASAVSLRTTGRCSVTGENRGGQGTCGRKPCNRMRPGGGGTVYNMQLLGTGRKHSQRASSSAMSRALSRGAVQDRPWTVRNSERRARCCWTKVGELSPASQSETSPSSAETRRFSAWAPQRSGGLDVRVIAATHRDLQAMVKGWPVSSRPLLPAWYGAYQCFPLLARRGKDDLAASRALFRKNDSPSNTAKPVRGYPPGVHRLCSQKYSLAGENVRELENVLGSACMMTEAEAIDCW